MKTTTWSETPKTTRDDYTRWFVSQEKDRHKSDTGHVGEGRHCHQTGP